MKEFQKDLIDWYIKNHRPLEFRLKKDPYEIWISEIMAQQTRIEAMLPYFKRWIQLLPDIESVAKCDDEKLNKLLLCKVIFHCVFQHILWHISLYFYTANNNLILAITYLAFHHHTLRHSQFHCVWTKSKCSRWECDSCIF